MMRPIAGWFPYLLWVLLVGEGVRPFIDNPVLVHLILRSGHFHFMTCTVVNWESLRYRKITPVTQLTVTSYLGIPAGIYLVYNASGLVIMMPTHWVSRPFTSYNSHHHHLGSMNRWLPHCHHRIASQPSSTRRLVDTSVIRNSDRWSDQPVGRHHSQLALTIIAHQ